MQAETSAKPRFQLALPFISPNSSGRIIFEKNNSSQFKLLKQKLDLYSAKKRFSFISRWRLSPAVPLTWVRSHPGCPYANLGDALSPILVSALSGLPIQYKNFDDKSERLAVVGTIGHELKNHRVHFWGTGVEQMHDSVRYQFKPYQRPADTQFFVHALRGPLSASVFEKVGIPVNDIYGDPVWFLPSIFPPASEKRYELGVIVHLSELTSVTDKIELKPELLRYVLPEGCSDKDIRIISTITQPTFEAIEAKIEEITACKRIISTSLHGLVIGETYRIPCVYFHNHDIGATRITLDRRQPGLNYRMHDFYLGVGFEELFVYGRRRKERTDWEDVVKAIDTHWEPFEWKGDRFLEAFPLPLAFDPTKKKLTDRKNFYRMQF